MFFLHKHVNTDRERERGRERTSDPPSEGENTPEALKWQQLLGFTSPSVPRDGWVGEVMGGGGGGGG